MTYFVIPGSLNGQPNCFAGCNRTRNEFIPQELIGPGQPHLSGNMVASTGTFGPPAWSSTGLTCAPLTVRQQEVWFKLFGQCSLPQIGISDDAYTAAADSLGCEVEAVRAVASVESSGSGFNEDGSVKINYERHYFQRFTNGLYSKGHPTLSGSFTKSRPSAQSDRYDLLKEAAGFNFSAALESASWGRFQIMGNNYERCGFRSVEDFVLAMCASEDKHLHAFMAFIRNNPSLHAAIQKNDWLAFARGYNGPKQSGYDKRMEQAYTRALGQTRSTGQGTTPR